MAMTWGDPENQPRPSDGYHDQTLRIKPDLPSAFLDDYLPTGLSAGSGIMPAVFDAVGMGEWEVVQQNMPEISWATSPWERLQNNFLYPYAGPTFFSISDELPTRQFSNFPRQY